MEYQKYCLKLDECFLKSEYISISQDSFKMFFLPKKAFDMRLYCFIIKSKSPTKKLLTQLSHYAQSAAFYDNTQKAMPVAVIPLFIEEKGSERSLELLKQGAFKDSGAYILPSVFDLEKGALYVANKFPILSSVQFKKIYNFAVTNLKA